MGDGSQRVAEPSSDVKAVPHCSSGSDVILAVGESPGCRAEAVRHASTATRMTHVSAAPYKLGSPRCGRGPLPPSRILHNSACHGARLAPHAACTVADIDYCVVAASDAYLARARMRAVRTHSEHRDGPCAVNCLSQDGIWTLTHRAAFGTAGRLLR